MFGECPIMLVNNTLLRMTRRGACIPVENLSIADYVYDPIADTYDEVVDILSRRITYRKATSIGLCPVVIGADALLKGVPNAPTCVSPSQEIVVLRDPSGQGRRVEVVMQPASSIENAMPYETNEDLTYYCIFFGRKRFLEVNGLNVRAYTLEDISCAG